MRNLVILFSFIVTSLTAGAAAAETTGYFRTPALHNDVVVFSSEGDLWRANISGGSAQRLTTHTEIEDQPRLSPNGQWIAFVGSYDGASEIYVMPAQGGKPVRLTYEGGGAVMRGWQDNNRIIYRTTKIPGTTPRLLRTVDRTTKSITDIPLADADEAALHSGGQTLTFTRYGLSIFSDNAVLYRGGRMAQLWQARLGSSEEAVRLAADFGAPIRHPMFWQGRIYFVSDKSGADNIWSVGADGSTPRQHTQRNAWQIKSPMLDNGRIIYQSGADLHVFDIAGGTTQTLDIRLPSDQDYQRRRWLESPLSYLDDARMSPKGDAVAVTARGKFAAGFTGDRRRVEYTVPGDRRVRSAAHSHDGKSVFAILDGERSGEIWQFPANGLGSPKKLVIHQSAHIWAIYPSPHDNSLLFSDKAGKLFHYDVRTDQTRQIDETKSGNDYAYDDIAWSSKGRYLSYMFYDKRDMPRVAIYDFSAKQKHVVTTGKYESFAPAFSEDGDWLYFVSNRHFDANPGSPWGDRNMGPAFDARGKIYALQLDPEAAFPFHAKNELDMAADDDTDGKDEKGDSTDKKDEKATKDKPEKAIVFAGLQDRLWGVPVPAGRYTQLAATGSRLFVREAGDKPALKWMKITDQPPELETYTGDVRGFSLSADRKTLFIQKGRGKGANFFLVGADSDFPKESGDKQIRLSDWKVAIDPSREWTEMARDAWRLHRDFAYDPNLRGVDWEKVGAHYLPMASRIGHRSEVNDLLAQMSAELGILHSQIRQGELPSDEESGAAAFLGAVYTPAGNGLRIAQIYEGERDRPHTLGPLLQAGKDFKIGDVITAINGQPVRSLSDLAGTLVNKSGQQILLEYSRAGVAKKEIIVPVSSRDEGQLRYADWVQSRREATAKASGGDIGYLHIRAMGSSDVESFARDFYEHYDKDGLIIDVRGNRGGNIDSWIIGTLLRQSWAYWKSHHGGPANTNMQQTFRGHLVVLINEGTYSDGETFAAGIKALDLAPLIGTRTAGAGIWLSDRNPLTDGGQARVAEFAQYGIDGRWLIEGNGISPDIEVIVSPRAGYRGEDPQLGRAVSYLKSKIASDPIPVLTPQPLPPLGTTGRDVD